MCKDRKHYTSNVETIEKHEHKLMTRYVRQYMHSLGLDTNTDEESIYPPVRKMTGQLTHQIYIAVINI